MQFNSETEPSGSIENVKKSTSEKFTQTDAKSESQIINIRIHMPAYKKSELIESSQIQPEIHIHIDHTTKKFKTNVGEGKNAEIIELRNFSLPKFGDVQFHCNNKFIGNSNKRYNVVKNLPKFSGNNYIDSDTNVDDVTGKVSNNNKSKIFLCIRKTNTFKKQHYRKTIKENNLKPLIYTHKGFKLKEAVVVLTDICKSNAYKNLTSTFVNDLDKYKNYNKDSCEQATNQNAVDMENQEFSIKKENDPFSSFSNESLIIPNSEFDNALITSYDVSEFDIKNINSQNTVKRNSLTKLAEGCNFSDIISRFKIKNYAESLDVSDGHPESTAGDEKVDVLRNAYKVFNEKMQEQFLDEPKNYTSASESNIFLKHTVENLESETYCSAGQSLAFYSDYDGSTGSKMLPGTIKVTTFSKTNTVSSNYTDIFKSPESNSITLSDSYCSDIELEILREEMKGQVSSSKKRWTSNKLKKRASETELRLSSSPKKMKHPNEESKNSQKGIKAPSVMEDYIHLEASGPTKFAVAPLNKLNPYKTRNAKNFKSEMLFGDRVNRFSRSTQQRIHNLKRSQEATNRPNYS